MIPCDLKVGGCWRRIPLSTFHAKAAPRLAFRSSGVSCVGCTALVASGAGAGWLASASCGCVAACGVSVFGACASLSGGIGSSPSLAPFSLISDSAPAVTAAAANGTLAAASGAEADGSAAPATATLDAAGKEALEPDLGAWQMPRAETAMHPFQGTWGEQSDHSKTFSCRATCKALEGTCLHVRDHGLHLSKSTRLSASAPGKPSTKG